MGDEVQVTMLLSRAAGGDEKAVDELFPMVYEELHRRAQQYMRSEREIIRFNRLHWSVRCI